VEEGETRGERRERRRRKRRRKMLQHGKAFIGFTAMPFLNACAGRKTDPLEED